MAHAPRTRPLRPSDALSQPLVRIAQVSEQTGVPQPTLRAWERRYGIPKPHRSEGGYRLYSAEEVACVNEMRALCDRGTPVSEAARLVRQRAETKPMPEHSPSRDPFEDSQAALLSAVKRFDDAALEHELRRLLMLGHPVEVLEKVLRPVLRIVGELWQDGSLTVAQEHLASQKVATLLRDLVTLATHPASRAKAVLACFPDDEHENGLLGLALKLADWGMRPVVLGARTPPEALAYAVASAKPALVALSLTVASEPKRTRAQLRDYAKACGDVPWIVGGLAAPQVASLVLSLGGMVEPPDVMLRALVRSKCEEVSGR